MSTMKLIRTALLAGLVLLVLQTPSRAQDWFGMATWNISFPTDATKNFVDETSFRGFGLDFRKEFRPRTSIGIMGSWEVFHERSSGTDTFGTLTLSGSQDHYINSFPIMLGLHRYFGADGGTRPYIGVNGGGFVMIQTVRVGIAELETDSWVWGAMPEAGFIIPIDRGSSFVVNARYNYAFTGENLAGNDFNLSYWGVRVGFCWEQY